MARSGSDSLLRHQPGPPVGEARPVRVAVVADVRVYREALAALLAREEALMVVATASRADAANGLATSDVDVLLVDVATEPAFAFVEEMAARLPETRIVALAAPESEPAVVRLAEAGVAAFVPADVRLPSSRKPCGASRTASRFSLHG